jgi:hypothetical protein
LDKTAVLRRARWGMLTALSVTERSRVSSPSRSAKKHLMRFSTPRAFAEPVRRRAILDGPYIPTRYPNNIPDCIPARP